MACPDIADWIASLIRRPENRVRWLRAPLVERNSGERLEGVTQDVEARVSRNPLGHVLHMKRVDDGQGGFQSSIRDASLCLQRFVVENSDTGGFAACASSGRNCVTLETCIVENRVKSRWTWGRRLHTGLYEH